MSEGTVEVAPSGGGEPAAPAAPAPAATPIAPAQSWQQQHLSDEPDLLNNATLSQIPDVRTLAKNHAHAQKLIGAEKVHLLNDKSTPEEIESHYEKLGRPATAADYDLADLKIPEGVPIADGFQEEMLSRMHKRGMSQAHALGILQDYWELTGGQHSDAAQGVAQARQDSEQALRTEWGNAYDGNVDLANRVFVQAAGDDREILDMKVDGVEFKNHPGVIRFLSKIGARMSEHGLVGGTSTRTTKTPEEAISERQRLHADPEFMAIWLDKNNPRQAWAQEQISNTYLEAGTEK